MTAWFRRACDRAFNLGLSLGELARRCHGETGNRQMVEAVLELEAIIQADEQKSQQGAKGHERSDSDARLHRHRDLERRPDRQP